MKRFHVMLSFILTAGACGDGSDGQEDAGGDPDAWEDISVDTGMDDVGVDDSLDVSLEDPAADPDADSVPDLPPDPEEDESGGPCDYNLIHENDGLFYEVTESDSQLIITPDASADGFRCIRMELDVEAPDNIDEIVAMDLGCPIFLHIAGISIPDGTRRRAIAASWFRFRAVGCTVRAGADLEVAVNANSTGFRGSVTPGRTYHVVMEVIELYTARLVFFAGDEQVGPELTLAIEGITRDRTNDFNFTFGIDGIGDGAYFPYFGARYSNLQVFADPGL